LPGVPLDRDQFVTLGAPSSLVDASIVLDRWLETETDEFDLLYGRMGAEGQTLLELEMVEAEEFELRFASAGGSYDTLLGAMSLLDLELDEDGGCLRGKALGTCAIRIDASVALDERRLESIAVTSIELRSLDL
jgi:hypothetical protein